MSTRKKSLTLTIAVYNAAQYLEFILSALQRQSFVDFEVIIADDGSGPEVKKMVERMQAQLPMPILHLWQPDAGFLKNAMLNKAIAASQTDYLVFIDGDCVPHHEFIRDHASHRQPDSILCGRRVNFSKSITERLTIDDVRTGRLERLSFQSLWEGLMARSSNLEDAMRIESDLIRRFIPRNSPRILGCNFSLEKRLLEKINGFNEDYQAPGLGEDSDVAFRLGLLGARFISLRYLAILYHLYHPATQIGETNKQLYERLLIERNPVCPNGLVKSQEHRLPVS